MSDSDSGSDSDQSWEERVVRRRLGQDAFHQLYRAIRFPPITDLRMHEWLIGVPTDEIYRMAEQAFEARDTTHILCICEGALKLNNVHKLILTPTEYAIFLIGAARAWLQVEDWDLAFMELEVAVDVALVKASSQSKWWETKLRTAVRKTREELPRALSNLHPEDDWLKRHEEGDRFMVDLGFLLQKLERDIIACKPPISQAGRSSVILSPCSNRHVYLTPPTTSESPLPEKLVAISVAHHALSYLWQARKGVLITACMNQVGSMRLKAIVKLALEHPVLAKDINVLNFISTRALRSPADAAFLLDLHEARTHLVTSDRFLRLPLPPPRVPHPFPTQYMLTVDARAHRTYGTVITVDLDDSASVEIARHRFLTGQACTVKHGEALIERQRVAYEVALNAARLLLHDTLDIEIPSVAALSEYEGGMKEREWAGREPYSFQALVSISANLKRATNAHMKAVQTDPSYVLETVARRLNLNNGSVMTVPDIKTALGEIFISAYARQTLWRDAVELIQEPEMKNQLRSTGVLPFLHSSSRYENKLALLANIIEEYVNRTHQDFKAMVESNWSWEAVGQADYERYKASDATVLDAPPRLFFSRIAALDPLDPLLSPIELVNMLARLKRHIDQDNSTTLPFAALKSFFSFVSPSPTLTKLDPLLAQMTDSWERGIPLPLVNDLFTLQSGDALDIIWDFFEEAIERDLGDTPDRLLAALLRPRTPDSDSEGPTYDRTVKVLPPREPSEASDETYEEELSSEEEPSSQDDSGNAEPSDDEELVVNSATISLGGMTLLPEDDRPPSLSPATLPPSSHRSPRSRKSRSIAPEPPPGPSSGKNPLALARAEKAAASPPTVSAPSSPRVEDASKTTREKRRQQLAEVEVKDEQGVNAASEKRAAFWKVTESAVEKRSAGGVPRQSNRTVLPPKFRLSVLKKSFETFHDLFEHKRVSWRRFNQAMTEIGFSIPEASGNSFKFIPSGPLAVHQPVPINFHRPHSATFFIQGQSRETAQILGEHYGLRKEHFVLAE
ncbi:hypothetical protein JCM6882_005544 [Rhodosporidiobolus microsporus]